MGDTEVTIEQGTLKGIIGTDYDGKEYYSFFGVPYAKPPIGKLRFKAPQPPEKWVGTRDATVNTIACYSRDLLRPTFITGCEDCLTLNIYTPELPKNRTVLKPVMLWIHGGGFICGSNNPNEYGPEFLMTEDVVLITINYRLGVLGFLQLDDPELGVPGNAGLKDMVMALKWVQKNIKYFGGDPNNVTVFGESAGGASVHFLMLSPMAKGLFHRAIAQSGCALNPWAMAKPSVSELAKKLNCPFSEEADILNFLQGLTVEELYKGQDQLGDCFQSNIVRPIGPVIEKITPNEPAFLSEDPIDIILRGDYHKVPLMIGYTECEGFFFYALEKLAGKPYIRDFEDLILHSLNLEPGSVSSKVAANKIKEFYYEDKTPSEETRPKQYMVQTDTAFSLGIHQSIKSHLLSPHEPIYFYRLTIQTSLNFLRTVVQVEYPGTAHADELGYLFKSFITPNNLHPDTIEMKTVRRILRLWTNFARTGNPNPVEDVIWEPVRRDKLNYLEIGDKLIPSVNPDQERMEFWENILK